MAANAAYAERLPRAAEGKVLIACNYCRQRRIRCDGLYPCTSCQTRNRPCEYPAEPPKKRGPKSAKQREAELASGEFEEEQSSQASAPPPPATTNSAAQPSAQRQSKSARHQHQQTTSAAHTPTALAAVSASSSAFSSSGTVPGAAPSPSVTSAVAAKLVGVPAWTAKAAELANAKATAAAAAAAAATLPPSSASGGKPKGVSSSSQASASGAGKPKAQGSKPRQQQQPSHTSHLLLQEEQAAFQGDQRLSFEESHRSIAFRGGHASSLSQGRGPAGRGAMPPRDESNSRHFRYARGSASSTDGAAVDGMLLDEQADGGEGGLWLGAHDAAARLDGDGDDDGDDFRYAQFADEDALQGELGGDFGVESGNLDAFDDDGDDEIAPRRSVPGKGEYYFHRGEDASGSGDADNIGGGYGNNGALLAARVHEDTRVLPLVGDDEDEDDEHTGRPALLRSEGDHGSNPSTLAASNPLSARPPAPSKAAPPQPTAIGPGAGAHAQAQGARTGTGRAVRNEPLSSSSSGGAPASSQHQRRTRASSSYSHSSTSASYPSTSASMLNSGPSASTHIGAAASSSKAPYPFPDSRDWRAIDAFFGLFSSPPRTQADQPTPVGGSANSVGQSEPAPDLSASAGRQPWASIGWSGALAPTSSSSRPAEEGDSATQPGGRGTALASDEAGDIAASEQLFGFAASAASASATASLSIVFGSSFPAPVEEEPFKECLSMWSQGKSAAATSLLASASSDQVHSAWWLLGSGEGSIDARASASLPAAKSSDSSSGGSVDSGKAAAAHKRALHAAAAEVLREHPELREKVDRAQLALYHAVLCVGYRMLRGADGACSSSSIAASCNHFETARSLCLSMIDDPSRPLVSALMCLSYYCTGVLKSSSASLFASLAWRLARAIGLTGDDCGLGTSAHYTRQVACIDLDPLPACPSAIIPALGIVSAAVLACSLAPSAPSDVQPSSSSSTSSSSSSAEPTASAASSLLPMRSTALSASLLHNIHPTVGPALVSYLAMAIGRESTDAAPGVTATVASTTGRSASDPSPAAQAPSSSLAPHGSSAAATLFPRLITRQRSVSFETTQDAGQGMDVDGASAGAGKGHRRSSKTSDGDSPALAAFWGQKLRTFPTSAAFVPGASSSFPSAAVLASSGVTLNILQVAGGSSSFCSPTTGLLMTLTSPTTAPLLISFAPSATAPTDGAPYGQHFNPSSTSDGLLGSDWFRQSETSAFEGSRDKVSIGSGLITVLPLSLTERENCDARFVLTSLASSAGFVSGGRHQSEASHANPDASIDLAQRCFSYLSWEKAKLGALVQQHAASGGASSSSDVVIADWPHFDPVLATAQSLLPKVAATLGAATPSFLSSVRSFNRQPYCLTLLPPFSHHGFTFIPLPALGSASPALVAGSCPPASPPLTGGFIAVSLRYLTFRLTELLGLCVKKLMQLRVGLVRDRSQKKEFWAHTNELVAIASLPGVFVYPCALGNVCGLHSIALRQQSRAGAAEFFAVQAARLWNASAASVSASTIAHARAAGRGSGMPVTASDGTSSFAENGDVWPETPSAGRAAIPAHSFRELSLPSSHMAGVGFSLLGQKVDQSFVGSFIMRHVALICLSGELAKASNASLAVIEEAQSRHREKLAFQSAVHGSVTAEHSMQANAVAKDSVGNFVAPSFAFPPLAQMTGFASLCERLARISGSWPLVSLIQTNLLAEACAMFMQTRDQTFATFNTKVNGGILPVPDALGSSGSSGSSSGSRESGPSRPASTEYSSSSNDKHASQLAGLDNGVVPAEVLVQHSTNRPAPPSLSGLHSRATGSGALPRLRRPSVAAPGASSSLSTPLVVASMSHGAHAMTATLLQSDEGANSEDEDDRDPLPRRIEGAERSVSDVDAPRLSLAGAGDPEAFAGAPDRDMVLAAAAQKVEGAGSEGMSNSSGSSSVSSVSGDASLPTAHTGSSGGTFPASSAGATTSASFSSPLDLLCMVIKKASSFASVVGGNGPPLNADSLTAGSAAVNIAPSAPATSIRPLPPPHAGSSSGLASGGNDAPRSRSFAEAAWGGGGLDSGGLVSKNAIGSPDTAARYEPGTAGGTAITGSSGTGLQPAASAAARGPSSASGAYYDLFVSAGMLPAQSKPVPPSVSESMAASGRVVGARTLGAASGVHLENPTGLGPTLSGSLSSSSSGGRHDATGAIGQTNGAGYLAAGSDSISLLPPAGAAGHNQSFADSGPLSALSQAHSQSKGRGKLFGLTQAALMLGSAASDQLTAQPSALGDSSNSLQPGAPRPPPKEEARPRPNIPSGVPVAGKPEGSRESHGPLVLTSRAVDGAGQPTSNSASSVALTVGKTPQATMNQGPLTAMAGLRSTVPYFSTHRGSTQHQQPMNARRRAQEHAASERFERQTSHMSNHQPALPAPATAADQFHPGGAHRTAPSLRVTSGTHSHAPHSMPPFAASGSGAAAIEETNGLPLPAELLSKIAVLSKVTGPVSVDSTARTAAPGASAKSRAFMFAEKLARFENEETEGPTASSSAAPDFKLPVSSSLPDLHDVPLDDVPLRLGGSNPHHNGSGSQLYLHFELSNALNGGGRHDGDLRSSDVNPYSSISGDSRSAKQPPVSTREPEELGLALDGGSAAAVSSMDYRPASSHQQLHNRPVSATSVLSSGLLGILTSARQGSDGFSFGHGTPGVPSFASNLPVPSFLAPPLGLPERLLSSFSSGSALFPDSNPAPPVSGRKRTAGQAFPSQAAEVERHGESDGFSSNKRSKVD